MKEIEFERVLKNARQNGRPLCFYHRATGLKGQKSLSKCLEAFGLTSLDGVEFDVQATADGQVVIRHNFAFQTPSDWKWVKKVSLEFLRQHLSSEECPTLKELFSGLGSTEKIINIELKQPGIAQKVIQICRAEGFERQLVLTTCYQKIFEEIQAIDDQLACIFGYPRDLGRNLSQRWWVQPGVKLMMRLMRLTLPKTIANTAKRRPTRFFSFSHQLLSRELVKAVRDLGGFCFGATLNIRGELDQNQSLLAMKQMVNWGVDLALVDYPELFSKAVTE